MKSFKSFMVTKKKNSGVIPTPIHFKSNLYIKENESSGEYDDWLYDDTDNRNLGRDESSISKKLSETNNFKPEEKKAIKAYTGHSDPENQRVWQSYQLNHSLINNKPIPPHLQHIDDGLSSAIKNNPIQHRVRVYSGLSFNPMDHVDKDGKMKSPAYISATHAKNVATEFSHPNMDDPDSTHIMQIHLNPGDPATHVDAESSNPGEHETIINKGVTLQHLMTETYTGHPLWGDDHTVHVHHFGIVKE